MAGGVLEVQGVPPDAPEELLILYFESRRRSGGGPVQSCQRLGPLLFLTFEDPQGKRGWGSCPSSNWEPWDGVWEGDVPNKRQMGWNM